MWFDFDFDTIVTRSELSMAQEFYFIHYDKNQQTTSVWNSTYKCMVNDKPAVSFIQQPGSKSVGREVVGNGANSQHNKICALV